MIILAILGGLAVLALVFGPQFWIRQTMAQYAGERSDFPGTGGELARHLLDAADLQGVKIETTSPMGDHYSPDEKVVRLSEANFNGKSITAIAVAAHEVAHAVQHRDGYAPLIMRQKLARHGQRLQMIGQWLLMASPLIFAVSRSPIVLAVEIAGALAIMASTLVIHIFTLPTEFDASFKKALPALQHYIKPEDMAGATKVLRAAAFTYVASALVSLLNAARWIKRF
jgi:uncharacterized protein